MKATRVCLWLVLYLSFVSALLSTLGCGAGPSAPTTNVLAPPQSTTKFLIVADSFNHRILLYTAPLSMGESANIVLGQTDFVSSVRGTSTSALAFPAKAIADAAGDIWVADTFNNRVLEFRPPISNGMTASVVLGKPDFMTSGFTLPTQNELGDPLGMAFDATGNLWVVDGYNRVVEFSPPFTNGMNAALVLGQPDFISQTKATSVTGMSAPSEIAFDPSGNLWVVERDCNRVVEYKPPFSSGQAASVVLGQPDFNTSALATTATGLGDPYGVATDSSGNIWVSDSNNLRILEFSPPFSNGQSASLVIGQPNFTTAAVSGNGQIDVQPFGIAFDKSGNLIVAETTKSRITVFVPPFSTQMKASILIGQPNFNTVGTTTSAIGLAGVESISAF